MHMARDPGVEAPARALYERITREKVLLGWSDSELARRSGVDRTTYVRLQTNKRAPQPDTVQKLADAVGLDRTEALQLAGLLRAANETPTVPIEVPDLGQDEEIASLLAQLPPDRRRLLLKVAEQERERLRRLREQAEAEVADTRARYIALIEAEAQHDRNGE